MKKTTFEDFQPVLYSKPITEKGHIYTDGSHSINYSFILTRLIQEAGRWCERFASDLFIDWRSVEWAIDDPYKATEQVDDTGMREKHWLFGFREDGVDHSDFIFSRYASGREYGPREYRKLCKLTLRVAGDDTWLILQEVQR